MTEPTSSEPKFQNSLLDWILRTVIFLLFLFFGAGKFKSDASAPWVVTFDHIGFGQWFRYVTGVIEIIGAFLVLIPRTVETGLAVLMGTMVGAMVIVIVVLHHPADAFFPFALMCAMIALWMRRRRV